MIRCYGIHLEKSSHVGIWATRHVVIKRDVTGCDIDGRDRCVFESPALRIPPGLSLSSSIMALLGLDMYFAWVPVPVIDASRLARTDSGIRSMSSDMLNG